MIKTLFLSLITSFSFAQEPSPAPVEDSLFTQVLTCKNNTYKKMKTLQDDLAGNDLFSLLGNLERDHEVCLNKIKTLQESTTSANLKESIPFKTELLEALSYSEKRLLVDKKVIEIFLKDEVKPSELEIARQLIGRSGSLRDSETLSWVQLVNKMKDIKNNGQKTAPPETSSDWLLWFSIGFVGFLMYTIRKRKKEAKVFAENVKENPDLEQEKPKSPFYLKMNKFVDKINAKADEIQAKKDAKRNKDENEDGDI